MKLNGRQVINGGVGLDDKRENSISVAPLPFLFNLHGRGESTHSIAPRELIKEWRETQKRLL